MKRPRNGKGMKAKGDLYERALARLIDATIFDSAGHVSRTPLSGGGHHIGGGGMPDLIGTPHVWVEAKRTERFAPYEAMAQAERGVALRRSPDMPVVISRRSRIPDEDSLVIMRLRHWLILYAAFLSAPATSRGEVANSLRDFPVANSLREFSLTDEPTLPFMELPPG